VQATSHESGVDGPRLATACWPAACCTQGQICETVDLSLDRPALHLPTLGLPRAKPQSTLMASRKDCACLRYNLSLAELNDLRSGSRPVPRITKQCTLDREVVLTSLRKNSAGG